MPCHRQGWQLLPFVMDTWGAMSPEATRITTHLIKLAVSDRLGWLRRQKEASIWQSLTIAPMKIINKQLRVQSGLTSELLASATSIMTHVPYS